MTSELKDKSSTQNPVRIALALVLLVMMVFPEAGWAQSGQCNAGSWTSFPFNLPNSIETLNAVANNGYLYVVGGSTGINNFRNTVSFVQLDIGTGLPVASSTSFAPTTQLPVGLSRDLCGVASNGYLYTVGGVEPSSGDQNGQAVNYVQYAKFHHVAGGVDGTIEHWTTQTQVGALPPIQLHGTVVLNGYMYVIGGITGQTDAQSTGPISKAVYYAKINTDGSGSVQPFQTTSSLKIPLDKTCPIVVGNTIYMIGGETDANDQIVKGFPAVNTVYYATQNQSPLDGTLSAWTKAQYTIPLTNFVNSDATGLASQALVYVNTRGAVLMGGDDTGKGGDTAVVVKGANITNSTINWSFPPEIPGPPPSNVGVISRNAGATLNHFAYSVAGLYKGSDSNVVRCLAP